jgi:hypothetical protein
MDDQQAFEQLKEFFENKPACREACGPLRKNVEIGIVLNDRFNCVFFKENEEPRFEAREAKNPDVIFYMKPEAVKSLIENPSDDVGELGITIAKNYLAGSVKIKIKGSMISLLTNGYLGVIKSGGMSFGKFLASHGISGLGKIKDFISSIRK